MWWRLPQAPTRVWHAVALTMDGRVVTWYGSTIIPNPVPDLTNVIAIAANYPVGIELDCPADGVGRWHDEDLDGFRGRQCPAVLPRPALAVTSGDEIPVDPQNGALLLCATMKLPAGLPQVVRVVVLD
jgi:hypothetical protein